MANDPCAPITLESPDGATLTVSAYGGQVLGWSPSPGLDRLYLSPLSRCGDGQAIRGGVPVVFPQFSARGPLPKHGVVRDRRWTHRSIPDPSAAVWRAQITQDDATLAVWPFPFRAELEARASAASLSISLTVTNSGDQPFSFAAALHTYFSLVDPDAAIAGLSGHAREENASAGSIIPAQRDDTADWPALEQRDVRLLNVEGPVTLTDPGRAPLVITADGFPDRVAWNPGPGHGIGDLPPGAERAFVCVEPAVIDPIELAPGETWTGQQSISVGEGPSNPSVEMLLDA